MTLDVEEFSHLEYRKLQSVQQFAWTWPKCISDLHSLPFAEISDFDLDLDLDSLRVDRKYNTLKLCNICK